MVKKIRTEHVFLFFILASAAFLRFYHFPTLMAFGGDVARDFLVARDITLKGEIPLLGSPSSVPWLHQGALFTYILGIVLWIGKYNPVSGGLFVGFMGVLGVFWVFYLGKRFFSEKAGLIASLLYACFPLIIVFDRYPYHQSLISLFTMLFIFSLFKSVNNSKPACRQGRFFILSSFILGLLLQLELSNLVILPILLIWFIDFKEIVSRKIIIFSVAAFLFTWIPKIIYDFQNGFTQTLGFIAWIIHKFLPTDNRLTLSVYNLRQNFLAIFEYFPMIAGVILLVLLLKNFKIKGRKNDIVNYLLILWFMFPFFGFLFQGLSNNAYLTVLFAWPMLLWGKFVSEVKNRYLLATLFIILLIFSFSESLSLVKNNYFLQKDEVQINNSYSHGEAYSLIKSEAISIVNDTKGREYNLIPMSEYAHFPSSDMNLIYLTWYFGNQPSEKNENLKYFVYNRKENLVIKEAIVIKEFPNLIIAKKTND